MKTNDSSGWEWGRIQKEKLAQNARDNDGRCEAGLDGCLGIAEEVHHVVARVIGGGDNDQALMALCSVCHYRYTTELNRQLAEQRREAKKQAKRKNHPGRKDRHE